MNAEAIPGDIWVRWQIIRDSTPTQVSGKSDYKFYFFSYFCHPSKHNKHNDDNSMTFKIWRSRLILALPFPEKLELVT